MNRKIITQIIIIMLISVEKCNRVNYIKNNVIMYNHGLIYSQRIFTFVMVGVLIFIANVENL